jgi:hypothetical protein
MPPDMLEQPYSWVIIPATGDPTKGVVGIDAAASGWTSAE